jgi:hypothetical protein
MKDSIDAAAFCFAAVLVIAVGSYVCGVVWSVL